MSVRLLREYLGYRPTYLANTFVVNDKVLTKPSGDMTKAAKKSARVGAYDGESDDDMSLSGSEQFDVMPGDYPDADDRIGGFMDLISGAYEEMGQNTITVVGGMIHTVQHRPAGKSASTVSEDVREMFSAKTGSFQRPDTESINALLEDIARKGSGEEYSGGQSLSDYPQEYSGGNGIWDILGGSDQSADEMNDENAAGLSIMDIIEI